MQLELDFSDIPSVVRLEPRPSRRQSKRSSPAGAPVIAFPLTRQRSKLDAVERGLSVLHGKRRDRFWRQTITELRRHLTALGLPKDRVERELWAFHAALERRLTGGQRRGGGAA